MLLCLGLDYKRGGFVDRALEAFREVLRLDPEQQYALSNLRSCTRSSISGRTRTRRVRAGRAARAGPAGRGTRNTRYLENEIGLRGDETLGLSEAARRFAAAIELDRGTRRRS